MMIISIEGETPSKKNSRINTRSGRSFPNKRFTEWHKNAVAEIKEQIAMEKKLNPPLDLSVIFYHADRRRRDSDNQLSSILDTLVDAEAISDDKWEIVPQKHIYDVMGEKSFCMIMIREIKK